MGRSDDGEEEREKEGEGEGEEEGEEEGEVIKEGQEIRIEYEKC